MSRKVQVGCDNCGALFYANRQSEIVACPKCGMPCATDGEGVGVEE